MARPVGTPHSLGWALALCLALAACAGTPTTTSPKGKPGKPASSPGVLNGSTSPEGDQTPGSPVPSGTSPAPVPSIVASQPAPVPSVLPSVGPIQPSAVPSAAASLIPLSPENQALRPLIESKLLLIAQASYVQGRSTVIANNGGNLIAGQSAGILSNNGSSYRVLQAAGLIDPAARTGELLFADRRFTDGSVTMEYTKDFAKVEDYLRRIRFTPDGKPYYEFTQTVLARTAEGKEMKNDKAMVKLDSQGRLSSSYGYTENYDTAGNLTDLAVKPGTAKFRDPDGGAAVDMDVFSVDLPTKTGAFKYMFQALDLVETGTLENVTLVNGKVQLSFDDPLGFYDGKSSLVNAAGKLLYTKQRKTEGDTRRRTYDLQDGLVIKLSRSVTTTNYAGDLLLNDKIVAGVTLEVRTDGSTLFHVTFPEAPSNKLTVGYGLTAPATTPPSPTPSPAYQVATLSGAIERGNLDGPAASARWGLITQIARSKVNPARYYVLDAGNSRIRTLTLSGDSGVTAAYAGSGVKGHADGPAAQAQFAQPFGLAVGPDDTLYVTEAEGNYIRKVAPDGTVSTIAGDAVAGFAEGAGADARFNDPWGLALNGSTLYVADNMNNRIRAIDVSNASFPVTTFAGAGADWVDGPAASARFSQPTSLFLDGQRLVVADRANKRIRAIALDQPNAPVTTLAGSGILQKAYIDGPALEGGFNPPFALTVGTGGTIFFARSDIRTVNAAGQLRSYAGLAVQGDKDGPLTEAGFGDIYGLAQTEDGRLLATSQFRIRVVLPPK